MGYGELPECAVFSERCWSKGNPDRADETYEEEAVLNFEHPKEYDLSIDPEDVPCVVPLCDVCFDNAERSGRCSVCRLHCLDNCLTANGLSLCELCLDKYRHDDDVPASDEMVTFLELPAKTRLGDSANKLSADMQKELHALIQCILDLRAKRAQAKEEEYKKSMKAAKRKFVELGIEKSVAKWMSTELDVSKPFQNITEVVCACLKKKRE